MTGKIDIPFDNEIKQLDEKDISHSDRIFFLEAEDFPGCREQMSIVICHYWRLPELRSQHLTWVSFLSLGTEGKLYQAETF